MRFLHQKKTKFGTNTKLFCGVIVPISTRNFYLYCSLMMLLACVGTSETMAPMVPTRNHLKWCNSLPACEKPFVTIKENAICKLPCQIDTYSLAMGS